MPLMYDATVDQARREPGVDGLARPLQPQRRVEERQQEDRAHDHLHAGPLERVLPLVGGLQAVARPEVDGQDEGRVVRGSDHAQVERVLPEPEEGGRAGSGSTTSR
jgi:hypothetical protein